jgi:CMP-N,N'-diacetyllegionaminic acid synthase
MTIIAVIPARGGSKGIPRKNLALINKRPLIVYSIDAARQAHAIDRTWVSTDDAEIAEVSRESGAEVPFMRPADLADDAAPMLGVLRHALEWHEETLGALEAVVLLQPTSPLRQARHIDEAVALFRSSGASSVVSVMEVPHQFNPTSVMSLREGVLQPFLEGTQVITRRQDKPRVFARNGPAVLVCHPDTLKAGELYGQRCVPYVMSASESLDIDTQDDLRAVEQAMQGTSGAEHQHAR